MLFLKKGFVIWMSILVFMGIIAGCSSSTTSKSKSDDGKVKLRMVESITSPARTKLLREMLDKFEKENPKIKVELISPPLKSADEKISQML